MLFAMYLVFTRDPPKVTDSQNAVLDVLVASAVQGYEPAQAVVPMAYEFFESELPLHVSNNLLRWLERAVASGSITARIYLKRLNSTAFSRSIEKFRASGGYNWIYCAIDPSTTHLETFLDSRYSKLHWLATYGTLGDLLGYMDSNKNWKIDSMTENRETSLYLACARGSWEIASVLLRHGARPSIKCTSFKISCLHWLFAFPEDFQLTAAAELIRYGADLDAVAPLEVPFLHYPFVLPPGTPLHWAVATSSPETVRVLVQNGANVLLRNGIDPYVFDDRVRWLNKFDGPDQHGYSISEIATQGLSPLDLAAIQHDPFIFNTLLSLSKQVNINAADEEGFTVLHRLSTKPEGRRRDGGAFSSLPFRGCRAISEENLKSTVATIISLGGDLEQLTTPSAPKAQKAQVNWDGWKLPRYTPLMLALRSPAIDVLKVLLESGASVHTENDLGETVLHCFPQDKISCGESVRLIISHGADVNHRSISGAVPIVKAAQYKLLDVVEALLSAGANIDERECNSIAIEEGANVFALLARATFRDDEDLQVARLLETYVFFCADQEKRRRIVEIGDKEGQTLLHAFAKSSMPCCVDTLLRHGAPANALMKKFTFTLQSKEVGVKSSWYETPMDSLLDIKAFRESQMARYRLWSIQEYGRICQRDNGIIASLKKAGGNSTLKVVVKAEFIYKGPQNEFRRALRDYL
jgi:ankyrin repeat protein